MNNKKVCKPEVQKLEVYFYQQVFPSKRSKPGFAL